MKELDLPITQTVSVTVYKEGSGPSLDNGQTIPLINEAILTTMKTARKNGGVILYATTSIEQGIEKVLFRYFMGAHKGVDARRDLFEREILQSSALSFNAKKELMSKVVDKGELLAGKDKNRLQKNLKQIIQWRNGFAHGTVRHDAHKGPFLKYYSGGNQELLLTDEFWAEVETVFAECRKLLESADNALED